jgi:hypothetical protein
MRSMPWDGKGGKQKEILSNIRVYGSGSKGEVHQRASIGEGEMRITCPICSKECDGSGICPQCKRKWIPTGDSEAPLVSERRKVRLLKVPEPGDRLDEVIAPAKEKG